MFSWLSVKFLIQDNKKRVYVLTIEYLACLDKENFINNGVYFCIDFDVSINMGC